MLRRRFLGLAFIALLVLGLMSIGGVFGWSEGYAVGAANNTDGSSVPFILFAIGFPFLFGLGLIFKLLFIFLIFGFIGKLFFFRRWKGGGPRGGPWGRHGRHHPDYRRHREGEEPQDETPESTAPDRERPGDAPAVV